MNEKNSLEKEKSEIIGAAETESKALADGELDDVNGGVFFMTLEDRAIRGKTAMFASTLEDKLPGGKKQRRGVRVQTLENRPEDRSPDTTKWL